MPILYQLIQVSARIPWEIWMNDQIYMLDNYWSQTAPLACSRGAFQMALLKSSRRAIQCSLPNFKKAVPRCCVIKQPWQLAKHKHLLQISLSSLPKKNTRVTSATHNQDYHFFCIFGNLQKPNFKIRFWYYLLFRKYTTNFKIFFYYRKAE